MDTKDLLPWMRGRSGGPMDPFRRMREDMDRMLASFPGLSSPTLGFGADEGMAAPSLDICEDDGAVEVKIDVPGVAANDIDVSIDNGVLTVSGKREEEKTEGGEGKSFHRVERYRGHFVRRIALPAGIDENAVEARHDNGVLSIRLPKLPEAQAKQKRIEIRTG